MENQELTRLTKVQELMDFYRQKWLAEIGAVRDQMKALGADGLNPHSTQQVAHYMYDKLKLKSKGRGKAARSVSANTLLRLAQQHDLPRLVVEHQQLARKYRTYRSFKDAIYHDWFDKLTEEEQKAETERWWRAWQEEEAKREAATD